MAQMVSWCIKYWFYGGNVFVKISRSHGVMSACDLEAMFYERRLYGLFLLDNTARGLLYKSQNVFDFGRHRDLVTNFLQAFGAKFSALVEQAFRECCQ